jgi:hypothetical protein
LLDFFTKYVNTNQTVDNNFNCHICIIVTTKINEFPKRSRASISKRTKQHILKAFNKIKEITHGDDGNVMKKHKIVEAVADIFYYFVVTYLPFIAM